MDKLEVAFWGVQVRAEGSIGIVGAVIVVTIALGVIRFARRPRGSKPDRPA